MHVTVIGAGYVGLVTGVSLARIGGHHVTLVEKNPLRLAELRDGMVPFEEPGLQDALTEVLDRVTVVESVDQVEEPDLVFVAVATPISESGEPDLTQIRASLQSLHRLPDVHVCVRSTLPPGTSARLPLMLNRTDGSRISTNPEFLRQGSAMADYAEPSRIVIGRFPETSEDHLSVLEELFEDIKAPRLIVDVSSAELIKNVANGFLALKLSFVNEVAGLAEEYGVDVDEVLSGIALDPRIGSAYMRPGLGFGGSCLPKELQVLSAAGRRQGLPMHVARAVSQVNIEQQDRFSRSILEELPAYGARVGMLGLSFKADTDDLRGSPAIHVARRLLEADHEVLAFDPAVRPERAREAAPGIQIVDSAMDVFRGADAVVIATEWGIFADIDLTQARDLVRRPMLFDGRRLLDPAVAVAAGFVYHGIGRQSRAPSQRDKPAASAVRLAVDGDGE
ncbi:MAG: nucleotide sugar dehydrogenase [Chloroflexi bacterium]|nr:nucleotide sugar dehydrogenase [Chloroflexota bacterium]